MLLKITVYNYYNYSCISNYNNYNNNIFVADNPGIWPIHCHIEWHMVMGNYNYLF